MSKETTDCSCSCTIPVKRTAIYPWEDISLSVFCKKMYQVAKNSGYSGTLDDFKQHFGEYLEKTIGPTDLPVYPGPHEVTPLTSAAQTLLTQQTVVLQNITVEEIPYYETTNIKGGQTVYIGE